jgi:RNA polymerase sigma-70 factor (ECF subfamily)
MSSAVRSHARLERPEFAALFARESRKLWCLAASVLGRSTHADDVLQEAAIVGLSKLDDFDPHTSFVAWMGRIVRFVAHNQRRKEARSAGAFVEEPLESGTPWSVERDVHPTLRDVEALARDGRTFDDRLQRSLATLSDTARACLLLKTVLELEYKEIAAMLSIPEGTAMSHVHRAREALRKSLSEQDAGGTS